MPAIIFDLDETLLDTSMLRGDRTTSSLAPSRSSTRRGQGLLGRANRASRPQIFRPKPRTWASKSGFHHSPRWYAERLLSAFGISHDALITGSDGYPPKPDPSSLRAIADELSVPVEDCIMVGDDAADIGAAQTPAPLASALRGHGAHRNPGAVAGQTSQSPRRTVSLTSSTTVILASRSPRRSWQETNPSGIGARYCDWAMESSAPGTTTPSPTRDTLAMPFHGSSSRQRTIRMPPCASAACLRG